MRICCTMLCTIIVFSLNLNAKEFKVQLAASVEKIPFTHFAFAGINDVVMNTDQNNIFRYYLRESFQKKEEAERAKQRIIQRGFPNVQIIDMEEQRLLCGYPCPYFSDVSIFSSNETEALQLKTIFFDFDVSVLNLKAKRQLDKLISILEKNPDLKVKVFGHTDSKGSADYNIALSGRRARAARNYLIGKGIPAYRIDVKVYGESTPVTSNKKIDGEDFPLGRKYNRRVVVALYDAKGEIVQCENQNVIPQILHPQLERDYP